MPGRLLLAEDDLMLAHRMAKRIRADGWEVDLVHDGEAALSLAQSAHHDVMLLDMRLPRIGGLDVLGALRHADHSPAVVLMSGYLDVATTLNAMRAGAAQILEKPVDPGRLLSVIDELASDRSAIENSPDSMPTLVGSSHAMNELRREVRAAARYPDMPVLIIGQSGTGKELVARAIHNLSPKARRGELVSINCAAIPETLFESEVFGYAAGAFTGAKEERPGLFSVAGSGTVFLDEVGELPGALQAKLLRALETRMFRPVGSREEIAFKARIVSATNRPLRGRSQESFRPDLFFRIAGLTIRTPRLSERVEDIPELAGHFASRFATAYPGTADRFSPRALLALREHDWPGNLRELRAVVQSAAIRASGVIEVSHVVAALRDRGCLEESETAVGEEGVGLEALQRGAIVRAYEDCQRNVSRTARRLKIPRSTLRDRLRRYGIR